MSEDGKKTSGANSLDETAGKGLFLTLVAITSLFLCLFLLSLWIIPYFGFNAIHPLAKWIAAGLVGTALVVVLWASLGLLIKSITGKNLPFFNKMRGISVRLFLPIMTLIGRLFGISKNKIRSSFIRVNNDLVLSEAGTFSPEEMLMLMPHCLQNSRCKLRLTYNVRNCKRCGKCSIAGLLELSDKYNIHLAVKAVRNFSLYSGFIFKQFIHRFNDYVFHKIMNFHCYLPPGYFNSNKKTGKNKIEYYFFSK